MQGLYNYFQCNFITCSAYRNTLNVKEEDDDDVIITDLPSQSPQSVSTAQTDIESTDALPTLSGGQFNDLALSASHCRSSSSSSTSFDVSYPSPLSSINPSQPSAESSGQGLSQLLTMFSGSLTEQQIEAVYLFSGCNYAASVDCLSEGPTLVSIIQMCKWRFASMPSRKMEVDSETLWEDMVAEYKGESICHSKLRISIDNQPAIDTGGVRRQVYTTVFELFASNSRIELFEGPLNHLRPSCSAMAKLSGLLKMLGAMISHCFCQEGIGFPYLSPTCYWYIVGGEQKALKFSSVHDLPADAAMLFLW